VYQAQGLKGRIAEMAAHDDWPTVSLAKVHVLFEGYVDTDASPFSVASTVTYVRDGDTHVIIDPGLGPSQRAILDPLEGLGVAPAQVSDVVLSHHHPDHTLNAALFPTLASMIFGPSTKTTPGPCARQNDSSSLVRFG
jgi:glyoxylase-like metal-dependent hydrolase (beta-lactamase superfamily II)